MVNKVIINNLKLYKSTEENIISISKIFPILFGNILRLSYVYFKPTVKVTLIYDQMEFLKFQTKFSYAILMHMYDNLDNIILEFLDTYHYGFPPDHIFHIEFNQEIRQKFIDTCNSFKGKTWNEIIDLFIDSFYELVSTATLDDFERGKIYPLNLAPFGATLVRTSVCEKIGKPYFKLIYQGMGEDTYFCQKAIDYGYRVLCHTGMQCIHIEKKYKKFYCQKGLNLNEYTTFDTKENLNRKITEEENNMKKSNICFCFGIPSIFYYFDF